MPGYIGFKPQFNPLSLQEVLAVPTTILGEYGKVEDAYNETANKAEALKALLGERNADNEAGWRIVDNYERQLGDLANNISKGIQGPEAYRQAKSATRYYRENMLPLESGIPAYQEELKKWNADPTMIGSKPVLESYIKNPLYKAQMMSGNTIQAEAMKAAGVASARRKQETADRLIRGNKYFSYYELTGFNPEEQQAYYLNSDSVPELKQLEDSITNKYVQQGYSDADARRYAKLGIIEGIVYDSKRHDAENRQQVLGYTSTSGTGTNSSYGLPTGKVFGRLQTHVGNITTKGNNTQYVNYNQKLGRYDLVRHDEFVKRLGLSGAQAYGYSIDDALFTEEGRLRTPREYIRYLNNNKGFSNRVGPQQHYGYQEFYNYLKSIGVDVDKSYKGNNKLSKLEGTIQQALNSQSTPTNSLVGYYSYPISGSDAKKTIINMLSSEGSGASEFVSFENINNELHAIEGNKLKKGSIDEESNFDLRFYPEADLFLLHLEQAGKKPKDIIVPKDLISTVIGDTRTLSSMYKDVIGAQQLYASNPNNEVFYKKAIQDLQLAEQAFDQAIMDSRIFRSMEQRNPNTVSANSQSTIR